MYKLKQELPKEFKIKVTPEQSEALQLHLFSIGAGWVIDGEKILYLDKPFVYLVDDLLSYGEVISNSEQCNYKQIYFEDYFVKVEDLPRQTLETQNMRHTLDWKSEEFFFPEKWCILVTEDNYQELNTWMHRNWGNYFNYSDKWIVEKPSHHEGHMYFFSHSDYGHSGYNSLLPKITTEQFRAKYGDLKPKDYVFTIDNGLEVDPRKLPIFSENNGVMPLEIKRLQSENKSLLNMVEKLTKYNEELYRQVLMLTENLETIKKVLK